MSSMLKISLAFAAGIIATIAAMRLSPVKLESRDVATVSAAATTPPATVGAIAPGTARQPGIPPSTVATGPTYPNAKLTEGRALAQALRKLQKHPPKSPPGNDLDDETVARIGDAVRARMLALQGDDK